VVIGSTSAEYVKWDKSAGTLRIKGLLDTALGESITDQNRVRVGKISSLAQVHLQSGGDDAGYLKALNNGTGHPSAQLWLTHESAASSTPSNITIGGRFANAILIDYNGTTTLRFDNDSATSEGPELYTLGKVTCYAVDILGVGALRFGGSNVLTGQIVGTGLDASGNPADLSEAVTKTDFNAVLSAIRAVSLMGDNS